MPTNCFSRISSLVIRIVFAFGLAAGLVVTTLPAPTAYTQSFSAGQAEGALYLPLLMRNFPMTPGTPVLNAITNPDGDGNYTVGWSSSEAADAYTLQEDDNAGFSSPTGVYSGPSTTTAINGRDLGTYYYRVRAANAHASSDWSNIESVAVTALSQNFAQSFAWMGTTSQELRISFGVEDSPEYQIAAGWLKIAFRDSCGSNKSTVFTYSIPVTNNHFDTGIAAGTRVTGEFTTPTTASGTFSYDLGGCTASGAWTAAFNLGAGGAVTALARQADGKILVGGGFTTLGGQRQAFIGRLNPDGSLDDAFNPTSDSGVSALAVQSDGKIVVGGAFSEINGVTRYLIARLNSDGSLDSGFNPGEDSYDPYDIWYVNALVIQADGKIVVAGNFARMGGALRNNIARLNPDGSLDTTFNPNLGETLINTLALQADGKILVGRRGGVFIFRLTPEGGITYLATATGASYNTDVYSLVVQEDGKILVGGKFTKLNSVARENIGRLNPDGTLDVAFDPGASISVETIGLQSDNKIVVGGALLRLGGENRSRIGRLDPGGTIDTVFNPGANGVVYALLVQPDGKTLVGGGFTNIGGETHHYLARLNADGTPDASFLP